MIYIKEHHFYDEIAYVEGLFCGSYPSEDIFREIERCIVVHIQNSDKLISDRKLIQQIVVKTTYDTFQSKLLVSVIFIPKTYEDGVYLKLKYG